MATEVAGMPASERGAQATSERDDASLDEPLLDAGGTAPNGVEAVDIGWIHLAHLSSVAAVNDALTPAASLLELLLVSSAFASGEEERVAVAGYSAVMTVVTFALSVFNFVIVVNMSGVSEAVGERAWREAGRRVQIAFALASLAGVACALLLLSVREALFDLYKLEPRARDQATLFFTLRVLSIPFQLVVRTASGVLSGYQRLHLVTACNFFLTCALVGSNALSLRYWQAGLEGCAGATLVVYAAGSIIMFAFTWGCPPSPSMNICTNPFRRFRRASLTGATPSSCAVQGSSDGSSDGGSGESAADNALPDTERTKVELAKFVRKASNMMIRSTLLSGSMWLMAVVASRLGTSQLAAHQICSQLWMLTSYVVDGFADVGTMLGGKLLGMGDWSRMRILFARLRAMSLVVGAASAVAFAVGKAQISRAFTKDADTAHELHVLWPLLSSMQVVNSLVFAYDGFIYATQRFDLVRNIMILGCLGFFVPALFLCDAVFHSLLAVWSVKAVLNAWRASAAIYSLHYLLFPAWQAQSAGAADP